MTHSNSTEKLMMELDGYVESIHYDSDDYDHVFCRMDREGDDPLMLSALMPANTCAMRDKVRMTLVRIPS